MNSGAVIKATSELTERQKAALISLLADEDVSVYRTIRGRIIAQGPSARQWLQPFTLDNNPVLRRRAQEIITYLGRQTADTRFLGFCLRQGSDLNLEDGAWLLGQTQYPDIHVEAYRALLDHFADELHQRMDFGAPITRVLATINNYLFGELRFTGNEQEYYDPDNSYLNCVIDRRTGNPINLCLVYLLMARRLHLPVVGIGLPGHFLCRYQSTAGEIYIDPFNAGKLLTKADCMKYLAHGNYGMHDGFLSPVAPRRILRRICGNLHQIYLHLERPEETARFQRYLIALDR